MSKIIAFPIAKLTQDLPPERKRRFIEALAEQLDVIENEARADLAEARATSGINSPGAQQEIGRIDAINEIKGWIVDWCEGTTT